MWVDMVAQKGSLPTAAITRDAVLSLWRNAPGYYYTPSGTQFLYNTGTPGTYGVRADVMLPVKTQGGAPEFMPVQAVLTVPTDALAQDILNAITPAAVDKLVAKANLDPVIDRVLASKAASGLATVGTQAALGTMAITAGITLLGAYFLLKYMR